MNMKNTSVPPTSSNIIYPSDDPAALSEDKSFNTPAPEET
eukprot:CAMPEP_0172484528 /NCGR_PEP_ID=MMETSP1066-20121228/12027_1 /TAXON_ID=671091 /ORGANISM="Coscinodiscus wailesii, Strain CCMP2513" /LENGTH=39 /DNA_ID= /DNA_START= /DNA_END= /DNA_ORIENTATION=